jgi:PAS domain S-box-containing protein
VRHQVIALRVLALVALGLLVVQTIRRLRRGIACVTEFANAAAAGELQQPLPGGAASRPREFNQILEQIGLMRNALRDNLRAVQQSAARSKAILRTMRDGVVQVDSAGIIINVNDALSETFGYEEDELVGKPFRILMPDAGAAPAGPPHPGRHVSPRRDAGQAQVRRGVPLEIIVNQMVDDEGSVFIGVVRDIVEQRRIQGELTDALARAQVATQAKSAFLANMSHEIRTPINAVIGFSGIALRKDYPDEAAAAFRKINSAGKSLLALINDILDSRRSRPASSSSSTPSSSPTTWSGTWTCCSAAPPATRPSSSSSASARRCRPAWWATPTGWARSSSTWSATRSSSPTAAAASPCSSTASRRTTPKASPGSASR